MTIRRPLVTLLLVLASWPAPHLRSQGPIRVPPDLLERARTRGSVDVIVGVDAGFVPEGRLPTVVDVTRQRAAVARAVEDGAARATAVGAIVRQRYDVIPFFRAELSLGALETLALMPGVTSIQENLPNRMALARSTPFVNAPPAWAAGATGAGWKVAVLDTGVETTHPFLGGRVVSEACYSGGGPGATSLCPGGVTASTAAGSAAPCASSSYRGCGHGTAVSGVAVGANGPSGASGVAPGAALIAIQVFSRSDAAIDCGSTIPCIVVWDADIVSGLNRVATLAGAGNTGRVAAVNLSIASFIRYPDAATCDAARPALKAAVDNLRSLEVAVIAGAGNDGAANELPSPACISGAIGVGATSAEVPVTVAEFSNDWPSLPLLGPGVAITTSVLASAFESDSGTSLATPHVAGAWAVLKQAVPSASVATVLSALSATGTPLANSVTGNVHPIVNVDAARLRLLGVSGAAPGAVTALRITATGNSVNMTWSAPQAGGASTGYTVLARLAAGGPVVAAIPVGNTTSFATGAPSGTYVVSVQASSGSGVGAESNPLSVTLPGLPPRPHRPTNFAVTVNGTVATFTWAPPAGGGPVANYLLAAGPTSFSFPAPAQIPFPLSPTAAAIPGVPPGTWYARLYSQNANDYSLLSSNEVVLTVAGPAPPGAPTLNAAVVVGRTVNLSWAPGSGGAPTSYVVTASVSPGGPPVATVPLGGTSAAFASVPLGIYYVRVAAVNALGTSAPSNQITVVVN